MRRRQGGSPLQQPLLEGQPRDEDDRPQPRTPTLSPSNSLERDQASAAWQQVLSTFLAQWAGWLRKHYAQHSVHNPSTEASALLGLQGFPGSAVPRSQDPTKQARVLASGVQGRSRQDLPAGAMATTDYEIASKQRASPMKEKLPPVQLSPIQEERLKRFQERMSVPFDLNRPEHAAALEALWSTVYPGRVMSPENEVEGWKEMGWQGNNPATDFRGGGLLSLENLTYFAKTYPDQFRSLMLKQEGRRAEWEYPFAAAGVNLTVLLTNLLDLRSEQPRNLAGRKFLQFMEESEVAFEELYCLLFQVLDAQWLEMKASYMEFNVVLNAVKKKLEEALSDYRVSTMQDLRKHLIT